MARNTQPRRHRVEVWCDEDEIKSIKANADLCQQSGSEFLRNLGQGYQPKSAFDREAIRELAKINGDQGRLGGLLKLWLSEKPSEGAPVKNVRSLLQQIESLQMMMAKIMLEEARRL